MNIHFNTKRNRLAGLIAGLGLSLALSLPGLAEGPSVVGGGGAGGGARGGGGSGSNSRGSSAPVVHSGTAEQPTRSSVGERPSSVDRGRLEAGTSADRYPNEQYRGEYSHPTERGRDAWPRGGMLDHHPYMNQWNDGRGNDSDHDRANDVRRNDWGRGYDYDRHGYDYRYRDDYRGRYYYFYNDNYYDGYYPAAPIVYYSNDYIADQPVASYSVIDRQADSDTVQNSTAVKPEDKGHYEEIPTREVIEGEFVEVNYPAVFRQGDDGKLVQVEAEKTVKEPKIRIILKKQWVGSGSAPARGDLSDPNAGVKDTVEIIKPDGTRTVKPIEGSSID